MARQRQLEAAVTEFLNETAVASTMTEVNIAAGTAAERILERRSVVRMAWVALLIVLLCDLLPVAPLDLGLLPDLHMAKWITGHAYSHNAGVALYHVTPEEPHVLGVELPWSNLP